MANGTMNDAPSIAIRTINSQPYCDRAETRENIYWFTKFSQFYHRLTNAQENTEH